MTIYLRGHHYGEIATFKLLWSAKFKSENSLIFGNDIHWNASSNRHYYFQNATEWHRTWVINLLNVFSFTIFNEPNSIIAYNKSSEYWTRIVASSSISTFTSNIVTQLNFLRGLKTILVTKIIFRFYFLLIFTFNVIFLDHHSFWTWFNIFCDLWINFSRLGFN